MSCIVSWEGDSDEPDTRELRRVGPRSPLDTTPPITQAEPPAAPLWVTTGLNYAGIPSPTFRSGDQYPKARIEHGRAEDDILMRYYRRHFTFQGALVYIKPNICDDPAAAARDDYYKADIRWPTFVSVDQYPKARIKHSRAEDDDGWNEDDHLWKYYDMRGTFAGAMVGIVESWNGNGDNEPVDVIWNRGGDLVMMQFRP